MCVPWKSDNFPISEINCGPFGSYNASVVLYVVGINVLLYYAQVGNISIALADYIDVRPTGKIFDHSLQSVINLCCNSSTDCGDGECQGFEDCTNCPGERRVG